MITIERAQSRQQIQATRRLFREYAEALQVDPCFEDFDAELSDLPGKYAPPLGVILLACGLDRETAGCVAVRPLNRGVCEMKRQFVRPGLFAREIQRRSGGPG